MAVEDGWKNLRPFTERDPEEARAIQSAGGRAGGEAKRRRRLLRDIAREMLDSRVHTEGLQRRLEAAGVAPEDATHGAALMLAMIERAEAGDVEAFRAVRDTSGEKPATGVELLSGPRPGELDAMSPGELAALEASLSGEAGGLPDGGAGPGLPPPA